MTIKAIAFDIGGVLEITPDLGVNEKWEERLHLQPGELNQRARKVWHEGGIGLMSLEEVHTNLGELLEISREQVDEFMEDVWVEYLGALNVELAEYFRSLRPRFQTAILSNSFVGAREREQEAYHFDEMCDFILYSHEVGMQKPDPGIYALTCERLGLQPSEVIFLDDREGAVDPACEFGIHGILFKDNAQAIAAIEACIQANASD
ncbi:MAG TPA: HAD family phosphatase [Anaerolineales bacterium]|nr:HAD family phosphatase [Anaerolineales bacterium]